MGRNNSLLKKKKSIKIYILYYSIKYLNYSYKDVRQVLNFAQIVFIKS